MGYLEPQIHKALDTDKLSVSICVHLWFSFKKIELFNCKTLSRDRLEIDFPEYCHASKR